MNSPPAGEGEEPNFCGVVFGGGEEAVSHVPLLKSIIDVVVVDGKHDLRALVTFSYPKINVMGQFRAELRSLKPTGTNPKSPPPRRDMSSRSRPALRSARSAS